eukprot:9488450-Pyramimonas_sp.AAC.1
MGSRLRIARSIAIIMGTVLRYTANHIAGRYPDSTGQSASAAYEEQGTWTKSRGYRSVALLVIPEVAVREYT